MKLPMQAPSNGRSMVLTSILRPVQELLSVSLPDWPPVKCMSSKTAFSSALDKMEIEDSKLFHWQYRSHGTHKAAQRFPRDYLPASLCSLHTTVHCGDRHGVSRV